MPFREVLNAIRGCAPITRAEPGMIKNAMSGGAQPPPHIGRHSREPESSHNLGSGWASPLPIVDCGLPIVVSRIDQLEIGNALPTRYRRWY